MCSNYCSNFKQPCVLIDREVNRAVEKCHELHREWQKIINEEIMTNHYDYDKICKDLRNNIRNVEWDLEDLEETINILF